MGTENQNIKDDQPAPAPRYLRMQVGNVVLPHTPALAARGDVFECDAKGEPLPAATEIQKAPPKKKKADAAEVARIKAEAAERAKADSEAGPSVPLPPDEPSTPPEAPPAAEPPAAAPKAESGKKAKGAGKKG